MIKIGPAGIGGIKEIQKNLEFFNNNSLKAAEVAFTYGIYLKKQDAKRVGILAKDLDISLSIHAPYYINLNSKEKPKITQSKQRILQCCEIGEELNATHIVFHAGYYGEDTPEETYEKIKAEILDLKDKNKFSPKLTTETTGKINVFGDLDQTLKLAKETKTSFCIDFAHLKARYQKNYNQTEVIKKIKDFKHIHCHYSGINYTEKGERNHIPLDTKETTGLLKELKKQSINCTIICEAPDTVNDSIKMRKILEKISLS